MIKIYAFINRTITNLIKTDTSQSTGDHESDIGHQGQGDHIDCTK